MQYTDRYGQPLAVGDRVVIALSSGRSSATMFDTKITALIPLIPHHSYNFDPSEEWNSYMREDQQDKKCPGTYRLRTDTPPDKLYVLQYEQLTWNKTPRKAAIDRPMDVIRVPLEIVRREEGELVASGG